MARTQIHAFQEKNTNVRLTVGHANKAYANTLSIAIKVVILLLNA